MKKFFQSKGFIVSSLALLCVTILGVCWFVSRDRTRDFRPDESPPSSVTGDWSDGGTQTDGDNGADAYAPGQSTDAKEEYLNGNLAIQMVTWESGDPEPWATLTVNLPGQRQKDHAFIDTNADSEFPTWLIRHGLAIPTGRTMQSGFCTYPEYRFRANRLQELDPEGYAGYLKNFERRCSA